MIICNNQQKKLEGIIQSIGIENIVKHEKGIPDISTYDEKLGKNTGPRVRKPLNAVDLALYKNELVEISTPAGQKNFEIIDVKYI